MHICLLMMSNSCWPASFSLIYRTDLWSSGKQKNMYNYLFLKKTLSFDEMISSKIINIRKFKKKWDQKLDFTDFVDELHMMLVCFEIITQRCYISRMSLMYTVCDFRVEWWERDTHTHTLAMKYQHWTTRDLCPICLTSSSSASTKLQLS